MSWHYIKKGLIEDSTVGPVDETDLFAAIFDKTINGKVLVSHPQTTQGQWVSISELTDNGFTSRWHAYRKAREYEIEREKALIATEREKQRAARERAEAERRRIADEQSRAAAEAASSERARKLANRKWEYHTTTVSVETDFNALLNQADEEGWEYVRMDHFSRTTKPGCLGGSPHVYNIDVAVFRRPIHP